MKIGILTLPLHTNYGGILQAYALQTVLERMGHEVEVFDKQQGRLSIPLFLKPYVYFKRILLKCMGRFSYPINAEKHLNRRMIHAMQFTRLFINRYIHRRVVSRLCELKEKDYDAIVVGSDQIWNADCLRPNWGIGDGFLSFTDKWNIKRIAYAASFGNDVIGYSKKEIHEVKKLIGKFNKVSLREIDGIKICRNLFNRKDALLVLDPTMLLDEKDYRYLISNTNISSISKGGIMVYMLDDNNSKQQIIKSVSEVLNLVPFRVNSKCEDKNANMDEIIQPPVENWINGFASCDFVITDSFHACVFSILFRKQFIVIGNEKRGMSRFHSLLSIFNLNDRLVVDSIDSVKRDIDYDKVYELLNDKRSDSIEFLYNAFKEIY